MGDACSYVCFQTWINKARTNTGLCPTMSFLNKMTVGLCCNFGRIVVRSVFNCGLFQDFKFTLIISWLFHGERKDTPRSTLMF